MAHLEEIHHLSIATRIIITPLEQLILMDTGGQTGTQKNSEEIMITILTEENVPSITAAFPRNKTMRIQNRN